MYCPNCGKEISESAHFCPYCGTEISQEVDEPTLPKRRKQHKIAGESEKFDDRGNEVSLEEVNKFTPSGSPFPNITIGIYLLINFVLKAISPYNENIMGIFIYTWIVLAIIFFRRNKENPFNWFVNIFILLQAILVFATGMMTVQFINSGGDSTEAVVQLGLLALLLITIIILLIKGNGVKNSRRSS